jgi:hypothetical protein
MDGMGFVSAGASEASNDSNESSESLNVDTSQSQENEGQGAEPGAGSDEVSEGSAASVENENSGSGASSQETVVVTEPVKETIYVDPFADLGDTEKSIFESIKNKDYSSLKNILDAITANYDDMSDIDIVRQQIKDSKPRWTDEMVDAEMARKYGVGLDEEEMTPYEKLTYQMQLLDDGDSARVSYNSKKGEIKFPETTKPQPEVQAPTQTPEQIAEFQKYWNGHIDNSVKDLTDEVIQVEVGRDGSKETFNFPISITDADKQSLKTLVSDFDINNDFQTRYVKEGVVDLKRFMSDRFKADNFDKLLKAAAAQGYSNGKLKQIAGDKNLDFEGKPQGSGTHDQVELRTKAASFFLSNGKNK